MPNDIRRTGLYEFEAGSRFDADKALNTSGWGSADDELVRAVTAHLYQGKSPKQIREALLAAYMPARVDEFWAAHGDRVMSKYGKLGFLYVDAGDFEDDAEMDKMFGGQKKIGQMALEFMKPASRCGDCTLNKAGFCIRYSLSLDESVRVRNARQARRVLNKFSRTAGIDTQAVADAQDRVDAADSSRPEVYDDILADFLASLGQPARPRKKGDSDLARILGGTDDANRPDASRHEDAEIESFVRQVASGNPKAGLASLQKSAAAVFGDEAKRWFRLNRTTAVRFMTAASAAEKADAEHAQTDTVMREIYKTLVNRYGERRANRFIAVRGNSPDRYTELFCRPTVTASRRIDTGIQTLREIPTPKRARYIGQLDDELRDLAWKVAKRGLDINGVRGAVEKTLGAKRLRAFEAECPSELAEMAKRALQGFGADDDEGFRLLERLLEENQGDIVSVKALLRRELGRPRTAYLLTEHPSVDAAVAASSRVYGYPADSAATKRAGGLVGRPGTASVRSLQPPVDVEKIAKEVAANLEPEPELLASSLPTPKVDASLAIPPDMEDTVMRYNDFGDLPDPVI